MNTNMQNALEHLMQASELLIEEIKSLPMNEASQSLKKAFAATACAVEALSQTVGKTAVNAIPEAQVKQRTEKIYTDGACSGNPGPGGWGLVCITNNDEEHPFRSAEGYRHTTNNRMELMAAIAALEMPRRAKTSIEIISDSRYVVDAINKGWLESWAKNGFNKPANPDLWKKLYTALKDVKEKHDIIFTWVKGHAGNRWNEMADRLAVEAAAANPEYVLTINTDEYYENNN